MQRVRIVIADDHSIVREGLKLLLESKLNYEVVAEATSGQEVLKKAQEYVPDVILMDISMPGMDGPQATRRLRQSLPGIKVLALSAYEDDIHVRQMMTVGAAGYILKRTASGELMKAIDSVVSGGIYIDPSVAAKIMAGFIGNDTLPDVPSILSKRESDVLRLMSRGHSNKEIGEQLCIGVKSVETYKSRFCHKLGLNSRAEIVRYAIDRGWMETQT